MAARQLLTIALTLFSICSINAQRVSQATTATLWNSTALQGQAVKTDSYTLTVVTNETFALLTFNATRSKPSDVGYFAFGTGTDMSDSDMMIVWPNVARSGVSWTISQRVAGGHAMPAAYPKQSNDFSIVPQLTTNSSSSAYTLVSVLRPLQPGYTTDASAGPNILRKANFPIIYAYSGTNPDDAEVDAPIGMHSDYGSIRLDLDTKLTGTVITGNSRSGSSAGGNSTTPDDTSSSDSSTDDGSLDPVKAEEPWTKTDTIVVAHAVFGCLAWLIVSPSAVLLARLGRHIQGWVKIHQIMQVGVTGTFTIICFATGVGATISYSGIHFQGTHRILGLVMLILLVVQSALGYYIHHLFDSNRIKRPIRNILHILFGLTISALGFYQIWTGFFVYGLHNRQTPDYIKAAYFIVIIFFACALLISGGRLVQTRFPIMPWHHAVAGLGRTIPGQRAANAGRSSTPPVARLPYQMHEMHSDYSLNEQKLAPTGWTQFDGYADSQGEKHFRRRSLQKVQL